jgi:polyhydroxyalkanoate synthesis regulator phasin
MAKLIEKGLLLGLGVLTLTRDKVAKTVNELVEEGEVKAEEAPSVIDRLVSRGEEEREELRKMVRDEMDKMRANVPLATRKDIEGLSEKIDRLAAQMSESSAEKSSE